MMLFFQDKSKDSKAHPLSVQNIGGVFVVLLCGLALAIMVAILEFCWNSRKNAMNDRQSLCSEMAEELRFAMRCHGSRQKPALRRSCSRCSPEGNIDKVIWFLALIDIKRNSFMFIWLMPKIKQKIGPIWVHSVCRFYNIFVLVLLVIQH
jgi:hypothetical protein